MSVDLATVKRVAHLARIAVPEADLPKLQGELNAILGFVEQLNEVDVAGVEPMTSVTPMAMKLRADIVNDGEIADTIVANAPASEDARALNAYVLETPEHALKQAAASDAKLAKGEGGPLEGLPLGIKDLFATKGVRTTAGSKILGNFVPPMNRP
jgi:aspartyl-tRNA(Asn)/glutamyl-tRNA(Gln) amidotransferase subunit C